MDLTYNYDHLGSDTKAIKNLMDGDHPFITTLRSAKKPLVIIGADLLKRSDGAAIFSLIQQFAHNLQTNNKDKDWKVFNVLHKVASQVSSNDLSPTTFRSP